MAERDPRINPVAGDVLWVARRHMVYEVTCGSRWYVRADVYISGDGRTRSPFRINSWIGEPPAWRRSMSAAEIIKRSGS